MKSPISTMKVAVVNCRSIKGKIPLFHAFIETENPDILIGTESWLNESIQTSEIFPKHFNVFRSDRPDRKGGGVFIAVKDSLPATDRIDFHVEDCEIMWCQLTFKPTGDDVFIGAFYRSNNSYNKETLDGLHEAY